MVEEGSIDNLTLFYIILLILGAILYHIVVTIDIFKQAAEGVFSNDERSRSFFSVIKMKATKVVLIYIVVIVFLVFLHNDYDMDEILIGYGVGSILMYAVAIGAAEFQLLTYCRFKFPSFTITWEERQEMRKIAQERERERAEKEKRKSKRGTNHKR